MALNPMYTCCRLGLFALTVTPITSTMGCGCEATLFFFKLNLYVQTEPVDSFHNI